MLNHFPNTPEARLGRNDSKNASATCNGLTSNGRPCRRALAASKTAAGRRRSSVSALSAPNGVVALVEEDGAGSGADCFCWQHKDQAPKPVGREPNAAGHTAGSGRRRRAELVPLHERSSIDTLVQKLGIEAVPEADLAGGPLAGGPLAAVFSASGEDRRQEDRRNEDRRQEDHARPGPPPRGRPARPTRHGFWASWCCSAASDDDYVEIVRHRRRVEQPARPSQAAPPPPPAPAAPPPQGHSTPRPPPRRVASNAHTGRLLSLIPQHLPPHTTSVLLSELVKPLGPADERGYIYIFWLTPASKAVPPAAAARSLLSPPSHRPQSTRRVSRVMTAEGPGPAGGAKETIMLKIGRAGNVTRRMHEWQRQCGYALNLVRWYPYVPSSAAPPSPQPSPHPMPDTARCSPGRSSRTPTPRRESGAVHKVAHVKRVERLIHLELAAQQVKTRCATCGKEHREWFRVEASHEGVQAVDACVRRWVEWAENEAAA